MLLVISPAKTLDFETPAVVETASQAAYLEQSAILIERLRQFSVNDIASLMTLSDKLAGLNLARFESWSTPFNSDNAKQAILAFKGDVYTGLDADTLDQQGFDYAQQHLRILSGLYGVLKPLDLIQPYRLEMGTKLTNPRGKDLYAFWGERLKDAIEAELALADGILINLASNEYFKALHAKKLHARIITPIFKDWKNGQYKMISFYAKKARGLMSRFIIDNQITDVDKIKTFDREGYRFSAEQSKGDDWVFIRDHD
ncbi:MAG: peroxide stress protein YaaA [Gammaproteobacteria bacterium]|nr:peroxide stress protein YaaA [Gammaproteobacteria bacterium]